jgi:peptidyl-prolyl cis-trans isomerase C
MTSASDRALQSALIQKEVGPSLDESKIRAKYDAEYAGKPGEEEIHARHILVKTEAEAKDVIAKLKAGADFATLAKEKSTDPAAASGGDLGFFKSGDMLPEFSATAFSLKAGQYSDKPVQTRYGWHVVKVEERRSAPTPAYEAVHDDLRQQMIQDGITKTVVAARGLVKVERFNPDGSPMAPAPAAAPAKP